MDPLHLIEQHYRPGAPSHRLLGLRAREAAGLVQAVAACVGREQSMNRPFGTLPR